MYTVTCPHCRRSFEADVLEGRAARYNGFKCPHCKLFVPFERVEEEARRAS
jgi:transposase-like protein